MPLNVLGAKHTPFSGTTRSPPTRQPNPTLPRRFTRAQHQQSCIYPPRSPSREPSSTFPISLELETPLKRMFGDDGQKPPSLPLTERISSSVENPHLYPDQNPNIAPNEVIHPGHYGPATNLSPTEIGGRPKGELPKWLKTNMLAASITVFIMFAVGPVLCAFGIMMRDDLEGDDYDFNCEDNYIAYATESADKSIITVPPGGGQYHSDCRLLYHWSKLLIAAGSLSIFRPLLQALPVFKSTRLTIKYSSNGKIASIHSPSKVLIVRALFSAVPAALYFASIWILGTSRFMTGPKTMEEWYRPIYLVCLGLICLSFLISLHQALSTGVGAFYLRGYTKIPHRFRPGT